MASKETRDFEIKVTVNSGEAKKELPKIQKGFGDVQKSVIALNQALELSSKAFGLARGTISQTFQALDQARIIEGVTKGFENLQTQAGLVADVSLAKLRDATKGLVSDLELMRQANAATQLGLDPSTLDTMADAATKLGAAVGRDAAESFNDLVVGVGRASPRILDNLGIIVKMSEAYERQAVILDKTVEQLSENEKAEAFRAAALDKIIEKSKQLADVELNAGQSATLLTTAIKNAGAAFASALGENEQLAESLQRMAAVIDTLDWDKFADGLGTVTSGLLEAGEATIEFLKWLNILEEKSADQIGFPETVAAMSEQNEQFVKLAKSAGELSLAYDSFADRNKVLASTISEVKGEIKQVKEDAQTLSFINKNSFLGINTDEAKRSRQAVTLTADKLKQLKGTLLELEAEYKANSATLGKLNKMLTKTSSAGGVSAETTKKIAAATKKLTGELRALAQQDAIENLKKQIEEAAKAGDTVNLKALQDKFAETVRDGIIEGLDEGARSPKNEELAKQLGEVHGGKVVKGAIDAASDYSKEKFEQSADFFSDALYNAMTGAAFDAEDIMKRVFAGIAGGFLSQLTNGIGASLGNLQGLGQQIGAGLLGGGQLPFGLGTIAGGGAGGTNAAGLAGLFGAGGIPTQLGPAAPGNLGFGLGTLGPSSFLTGAGVAAGAFVGMQQFQGISDIIGGKKPSFLSQAALAPLTGGASFLLGGFGGGGKGADQQARDAVFAQIFGGNGGRDFTTVGGETFNIRDQSFNVDASNELAGQAVGLTTALGSIFSGGDGKLKDDITGVFANAISQAENFNEVLLNGQGLLGELGLSANDAKNQLTALFLDGEVALDEFGAGVEGLNILATDNLVGENSVNDALNILATNLGENGKPRIALRALELAFAEMAERGIDETDEIRSYLLDRFGPEVADAFARLSDQGINSFTDFAQLSADQIFLLFSEIQSISGNIEEVLSKGFSNAADNSIKSLSSIISKVNEVQSALNSVSGQGLTQLSPSPGGGSSTPLASGVDPRTGQRRTSLNRTIGISS